MPALLFPCPIIAVALNSDEVGAAAAIPDRPDLAASELISYGDRCIAEHEGQGTRGGSDTVAAHHHLLLLLLCWRQQLHLVPSCEDSAGSLVFLWHVVGCGLQCQIIS